MRNEVEESTMKITASPTSTRSPDGYRAMNERQSIKGMVKP
jgi:hypothetical protein